MAKTPEEMAAEAWDRERLKGAEDLRKAKDEVARLMAKYEPPTPLSGSGVLSVLGPICLWLAVLWLVLALLAALR